LKAATLDGVSDGGRNGGKGSKGGEEVVGTGGRGKAGGKTGENSCAHASLIYLFVLLMEIYSPSQENI
jgi:hypothetical protein